MILNLNRMGAVPRSAGFRSKAFRAEGAENGRGVRGGVNRCFGEYSDKIAS